MPEPDLFLLFVRPLNRAGIRYVVSGSVAAIFYGEPRLTHDVDFVVFLNADDIRRLPDIFPEKDFYLPPMETILTETAREHHGHFNLLHRETGFKADMYPTGRDELNAWSSSRVKRSCLRRRNTSSCGNWNTTMKAMPKSTCATFAPCSPCRVNNWIVQL